jgi:Gram-negative porin
MKKLAASAAAILAIGTCATTQALADNYPIVSKAAPMSQTPPPPAACGSIFDFAFTACPLTWYGVTVYGTVDMGGSYMTRGTPFDPNYPTGAGYLIGAGGTGATNRLPGFFAAPNGLSQSVIGVKWNEPVAAGWSFVGVAELAFDPYSALLANAPQAMQNSIGQAENTQALPFDSSRWGWLAGQIYSGASSPTWGTVTFGRQNTLYLDAIGAYDPMGGSYAFSPIGFSGKAGGAGDTEDARWTTAIKYRFSIPVGSVGSFRLAAMGQPLGFGAYNPNQGAVGGGIGGDIKHLGPGILSLDVFGVYEKDAVNISDVYGCAAPCSARFGAAQTIVNGWPTTFPAAFLKATVSNQTSFMAVAKYSFGSWGSTSPVVGKASAPSGPSGIPLTLYAGYQWDQFSNPSNPQSAFPDDGFQFTDINGPAGHAQLASANGTAINNNAFNANCGTGGGCTNQIFQVLWTGAKYGITRDLDFVTGWYHYIQNQYTLNVGNVCAVAANHSQCAGWFDMASVVLDWRFLPKWDAYIGTMYSQAYGGIANADIARQNFATTAGVRFRF